MKKFGPEIKVFLFALAVAAVFACVSRGADPQSEAFAALVLENIQLRAEVASLKAQLAARTAPVAAPVPLAAPRYFVLGSGDCAVNGACVPAQASARTTYYSSYGVTAGDCAVAGADVSAGVVVAGQRPFLSRLLRPFAGIRERRAARGGCQ